MSRLTRALLAGLLVLAAVAVVVVPSTAAWQRREDASDLVPGLLTVPRDLRGAVSLGNGVYVQLAASGLLVTRRATVVWQGVDRGASVTAAIGRLEWRDASDGPWDAYDGPRWRVREVVEHSLGNLTITRRKLTDRSVQYLGRVFADDPHGPLSRAISITITRRETDSRILVDVQVPGADAVSLHAFRRAGWAFRGLGVQDDDDLLRDGRYPVISRSTGAGTEPAASLAAVPVLLSSASNGLALTNPGYSTFDLRHPGRVDTTAWDSELQATLYDGAPSQVLDEHAGDVGVVHPLPTWATSGAVVAVRGSPRRVLDAATRLQDADAAVAAMLVTDGGRRPRYPQWDRLVDRLASRDVRVITSVSDALALHPRASGPADEPQLLAVAREHGYLVDDGTGRPVTVPVADPDRGSVPGVLVDLTNPAAVAWYTGVLTQRMRTERLSGWQVLGGAELPPTARPLIGDATAEHAVWPNRWAAITRAACDRAGRPDCLLLQDTAGTRTAALTGAVGRGRQSTDYDRSGLGGALAASVNAGVSGLPLSFSAVGGSTPGASWWGHDEGRSDELLARWAELETFGPLLVTADGDHPSSQPQVWDSTNRLRAFARMTRVFAALAPYRRAAVRQAVQDGTPVVRPLWVSEPELAQDPASGQFLLGDALLVAPVTREGEREVDVALPPGRWVELFTGVRHVVARPRPAAATAAPTATDAAVPRTVRIGAPLGRPVVLYRADDADGRAVRTALETAGLVGRTTPDARNAEH